MTRGPPHVPHPGSPSSQSCPRNRVHAADIAGAGEGPRSGPRCGAGGHVALYRHTDAPGRPSRRSPDFPDRPNFSLRGNLSAQGARGRPQESARAQSEGIAPVERIRLLLGARCLTRPALAASRTGRKPRRHFGNVVVLSDPTTSLNPAGRRPAVHRPMDRKRISSCRDPLCDTIGGNLTGRLPGERREFVVVRKGKRPAANSVRSPPSSLTRNAMSFYFSSYPRSVQFAKTLAR